MSYLPRYRELKSSLAEIVIWAFEDDTLPVRENITIAAADIAAFPIVKGTVMAIDALTGLAAAYLDGDSKYGTAYGILDEEVAEDAIGSTPQNVQAIIGVMGTVIESTLTGIDANGKADLPQIKFV